MVDANDGENRSFGRTPPLRAERSAGTGLAVASLVLGILAVLLSAACVGAICGLVGLILAVTHLRRSRVLRPMAWWGLGLSILGLLLAIAFTVYAGRAFRQIRENMGQSASRTYQQWIGKEAPDIALKDVDGKSLALSELRGRRVVLDFWATWCPPCKGEIPHFVKLSNTYDADDLVIIGISSEDEATIRSFRDSRGIKYPLAAGRNLPSPYGDIKSIPTTFFIDRKGIIRDVLVGYHDFARLNAHVIALDHPRDPND
ncbi:MAG TPA: TlpA disulfide reductase family protein [Sedimentisphaerales bacterium]|nr:TlpA disulfide reductase family protein [Sedimentisphaerales bacterium]